MYPWAVVVGCGSFRSVFRWNRGMCPFSKKAQSSFEACLSWGRLFAAAKPAFIALMSRRWLVLRLRPACLGPAGKPSGRGCKFPRAHICVFSWRYYSAWARTVPVHACVSKCCEHSRSCTEQSAVCVEVICSQSLMQRVSARRQLPPLFQGICFRQALPVVATHECLEKQRFPDCSLRVRDAVCKRCVFRDKT